MKRGVKLPTPQSIKGSVFFCSSKIARTRAKVNGKEVEVILDSGASIPIVKKSLVEQSKIFQGREVQVYDWKNTPTKLNCWSTIQFELSPFKGKVVCLTVEGSSYDMLVPRPLMQEMKLNLHFDDEITFRKNSTKVEHESVKMMRSADDIKKRYPKVICESEYPPTVKFFEVPFKLKSETPVRKKPYTLSRAKQDYMRDELEKLKTHGIIRDSTSAFASPVILVPKPNGTWRMCTDYRFVNEQTDLISWPLPKIDEIIAETGGCRVFSTIDMLKGFWQQPLKEETKKYSAFITPFGTFEYNVNPFGWKNSPKYFQMMMDQVLAPHRKYCRWYIDDLIIFSKNDKEHEAHLNKVLASLNEAELKVNIEKSSWYKPEVVFLGRTINGSTKSTKEESVAKVRDIREPTNVKQVQKFLGLCGHFRSFIREYSKIARPLSKLTQKESKFEWGDVHKEAFNLLKSKITQNPVLTLPDFGKPFTLTTDASDLGTGAILTQVRDGKEHAIGYHSYTFNKAEKNYSTSEKEMLAVLKAVHYFRSYLDEQKFFLQTDHSALKELLTTKEPKGRTARWIHKLQEMEFTVVHKPGKSIGHADALSRLPQESENIMCITESPESNRIFVEPQSRKNILELYHDSPDSGGHDGIWRTYLKISKRFRWPKLRTDVTNYVKSCEICQRVKAKFRPRPNRLCLRPNDEPPMETVHLDFAELSKKSRRGTQTRAFLVAIDRNTRFAAARAGGQDAHAVKSLLSNRVFANTKKVITDHAKVFESTELRAWAAEKNIEILQGSPYNQISNGLAERLIRDLKTFIQMYPRHAGGWRGCLDAAVRHHNRSYCSTIGCSPNFALNGSPASFPADQRLGVLRHVRLSERRNSPETEERIRARQKRSFNKDHASKLPDISVGDEILVRSGNSKQNLKYSGPFRVTSIEYFQSVPKRFSYYEGEIAKSAALKNVLRFHPRRDDSSRGESSGSGDGS